MGGVHTLGFMSELKKGPRSRWVMNPYVFDNSYFKEVMLADKSRYFRTANEDALLANPDHKHWVEAYAQDQDMFFENYAKAHVAISEQGHDELICEMADQPHVDGGYVEQIGLSRKWFGWISGQVPEEEVRQHYESLGEPEPVLEIHDDHHH